jgi:long-chain acyl-CoA synthetase
MAHLQRAKDIMAPPPHGAPYSVPLPGTAQEGRTPVYRHWKFQKELLATLDPQVAPPRSLHTDGLGPNVAVGSYGP